MGRMLNSKIMIHTLITMLNELITAETAPSHRCCTVKMVAQFAIGANTVMHKTRTVCASAGKKNHTAKAASAQTRYRVANTRTIRSRPARGKRNSNKIPIVSIAKKVLEENVRIMGSLLSILNNMFNPSVIYIGGETSKFFPKHSEALYHAVEMRAIAKERTMPQILMDADCGKTVLRGAAEMVLTRWVPET